MVEREETEGPSHQGRKSSRQVTGSSDDSEGSYAPLHHSCQRGSREYRTRVHSDKHKRLRKATHLQDFRSTSSSSLDDDLDTEPRQLLADPDARRKADRAVSRQYRTAGKPKGRGHSLHDRYPRPHCFLPPDLRKRAPVRPEVQKLMMPEYICGYAHMMLALGPSKDMNSMLTHLANIAEDAATLKWSAVRDWTEACFDHLEDGQFTWSNHQAFASERMRISWLYSRANDSSTALFFFEF